MKKGFTIILVIVILIVCALSSMNIKEKIEDMQPNKTVLVEKLYDNWDEAKYAGEYLIDKKVGLVKFRYASRIGDTEKFKVTYASVSKKN